MGTAHLLLTEVGDAHPTGESHSPIMSAIIPAVVVGEAVVTAVVV